MKAAAGLSALYFKNYYRPSVIGMSVFFYIIYDRTKLQNYYKYIIKNYNTVTFIEIIFGICYNVAIKEKGSVHMNLNFRKAVCIMTAAFTMMSAFSGCKKEDGGNENNNNNGGGSIQKISEEQSVKERAFKVTELKPDDENTMMLYELSYKNGMFYSEYSDYITDKDENGNDTYYYKLYIAALDDTGSVQKKILVYDSKDKPDTYVNIVRNSIIADESGNISVIVEQGSGTSNYHLMTFDSDGNQISDKEMPDVMTKSDLDGGLYISGCISDSDGNIFIQFNNCVKAFDKEGNFLFVTDTLDNSMGYINGIILTNTGVPAICYDSYGEEPSVKIIEIDVNTKSFGAEHVLKDQYLNAVSSGSGDYICYAQTNTGIAGYRADTLEKEQVLNLLNIGVDTNQIDYIISCEDGSFVTGGYTPRRAGNGGFVCSHIIPVDASEVAPKKVLTLGCFDLDQSMRTAISEFNRENEEYTISSVCYADENSYLYDDYDNALTNFNNELIAGNIPDILLLNSNMPYDSYVDKGLFMDIYELMDSDPEYTRDKFIPNMLSALERDGKLYSIALNFYVNTYVGKSSRLAGVDTLTFDKADELLAAMPEGAVLVSDDITREAFISDALQYSSFVDYENGTCNFDSDEFKAILEKSMEYPAEITDYMDYEEQKMMVGEDKALLMSQYLSGFDEFNYLENGLFHEDAAFVGFPGKDGANGILQLYLQISIAADSEYKDGAWEFIKKTLEDMVYEEETELFDPTDDETYIEKRWTSGHNFGFPVLKEDLENLGIQYTIPYKMFNENGELVDRESSMNMNGIELKNKDVSEDDIHRYIDFLCSVDTVSQWDQDLNKIVNEEISAFAQGGRSADETAKLIQSRVSLYLSEQYS